MHMYTKINTTFSSMLPTTKRKENNTTIIPLKTIYIFKKMQQTGLKKKKKRPRRVFQSFKILFLKQKYEVNNDSQK